MNRRTLKTEKLLSSSPSREATISAYQQSRTLLVLSSSTRQPPPSALEGCISTGLLEKGASGSTLDKEKKRYRFQRKTLWVDSACADCPGFLVLGAAGAAGARLPASSKAHTEGFQSEIIAK